MTEPTKVEQAAYNAAKDQLHRAAKYLRDAYGRSESATARRILTAASKRVGTDQELDLTDKYITGKTGRTLARFLERKEKNG